MDTMPRPALSDGWDSPENAEAYAAFCRRCSMYRDTSEDLAVVAGIEGAGLVIDLACGTGASTEAILARLPHDGRVVAVDGSEAMLAVARASIGDPRVRWIHARAEELTSHVGRIADVVVCNSGLWQMDMPTVLEAISRTLQPGGRLAFNIGRAFIALPLTPEESERPVPDLLDLMQAAAVLYHGFAPPYPMPGRRRAPLTVESVSAMLGAAGFEVEPATVVEHEDTPECLRAWLSVPIFTERQYGSLPYERRMEALATAYERLDRGAPRRSRWAVFLAHVPQAVGARG
jgi:SAM-dependent methyltransferase